MLELSQAQIENVSGGISSSEQMTLQTGLLAAGLTLAAAGVSLTPVGAFILIGTSVAGTVSHIISNTDSPSSSSGSTGSGVNTPMSLVSKRH